MKNKHIWRINKWSPEKLSVLSDEDFINTFVSVIEDNTNLKSGDLEINNNKKGAPLFTMDLCLKEAERRKIPQETIAELISARAFSGKSFISTIVAPKSWKKYEIQAAKAIIKWLESDGIKLDKIVYDAKIIGKITKIKRQVDLWLERISPHYIVAVECKDYKTGMVSVEKIEAFQTKLADIVANKGVYVTKNGYQRSAETTAEYYGIILLTFDIVDKTKPPIDLNENQRLEFSAEKRDVWCLRHKGSAWYFIEN